MAKISIKKKERIIGKKSYKRSAYESVDDRSHSLRYISKINGIQNSGSNGLIIIERGCLKVLKLFITGPIVLKYLFLFFCNFFSFGL